MNSENHRGMVQDGRSEFDQLTDAPSAQIAQARSAKRRQIVLVFFAAFGCAIIGVLLFS